LIVVDASIAVSWLFEDESDELGRDSSKRVLREGALVPPIFPAEIANALLMAYRRRRVPRGGMREALDRFRQLPIRIDSRGYEFSLEIELAERHKLTAHDAMYLALAKRHRAALLTRDAALTRAATKERLPK
jgi:predicted nucleic acid-binding protein